MPELGAVIESKMGQPAAFQKTKQFAFAKRRRSC
jgi:hypothetical protein